MFKQFMTELITKDSIKLQLTKEAKDDFAEEPNVCFVHSLVLYRIYALYARAQEPDIQLEGRAIFFRLVGAYLYYDKFACGHGEEYYYYLKFNKESEFYKTHQELIEQLILSNDPSSLKDYIGSRYLGGYNQHLKNKYKGEK